MKMKFKENTREMERLGTKYGGWIVPTNMKLTDNSVCYLIGVGEDASFDVLLQEKYNCNIVMIDPTTKAQRHYQELMTSGPYTGGIQRDFEDTIRECKYDTAKMTFIPKGAWDVSGELKFFKQLNPEYVSQSLIDGMFGTNYDIVPVCSVKDIMNDCDHSHIDLIKLDIEGAECRVVTQMLKDGIFPTYILIEFDLYLKKKDHGETKVVIKLLKENGYHIFANESMNITFVRVI